MNIKVLNSWPKKHDLNTLYIIPNVFYMRSSKPFIDKDYICIQRRVIIFLSNENNNYEEVGKIYCYHSINDITKRNILYSVGNDIEYYKKIKQFDNYGDILYQLNDIAFNEDIYEEFGSYNYNRLGISMYPENIKQMHFFLRAKDDNAKIYYKNDKLNLDLYFDVGNNEIYNNDMHAFIGRNGCGKTYLMNNMLLSLISRKSLTHGYFTYEHIYISKIISVVFNDFDNDIIDDADKKKKIEFKLIRPRTLLNDVDIKKESIFETNIEDDEIKETIENAKVSNKCSKYISLYSYRKKSILTKIFELFQDDFCFKSSNMYKKFSDINGFNNAFNKLSNGHKRIVVTLVTLLYEIKENSFIFLDEPETNLYPGLISIYMRAIKILLKEFSSIAFVFTHSPVLIQQMPKNSVWKISRTNELFFVRNIAFNSLGENIGRITRELFDIEIEDSIYKDYLEKAKKDADKNCELFGDEAKSILYIMEKTDA